MAAFVGEIAETLTLIFYNNEGRTEVNEFSSVSLDCKAECLEFIYDIFKSIRWKCKCSSSSPCVLGQLITVT